MKGREMRQETVGRRKWFALPLGTHRFQRAGVARAHAGSGAYPGACRLMFMLLLILTAPHTHAQSIQQTSIASDDPVARLMARAHALVDERASAAEAILAETKLPKPVAEHPPVEKRTPMPLHVLSSPFAMKMPRLVLARYSQHRDTLLRVLAEEQLPSALLAVALVESRFDPLALSPKGARGIWQLMPATAERYGLTAQPAHDQRTHPEAATRAAARYLRDLYQLFGDWKLALAAYNAGEGRVQRAINVAGVRDFDELARRGLLPLETRRYVPAVLAAWPESR
jgi:hypothetical protein